MGTIASTKRLLIIEDDLNLALALYRALSHTYKVDTAKTATSGLVKAENLPIDLIILDLNLPDSSGLKVTKRLRSLGVNTPILVLSGENSLDNKIDLLESGANDYVTKPFSLAELKARISVLLRQETYPYRSLLVSGDIVLDPKTRVVSRQGIKIDLRRKEYELFECLFRNAGTAITRTFLQANVWGRRSTMKTNSIDVHIKSLRDKLDNNFDRRLIKTVHGIGYILDIEKPKAKV